MADEQLFVARFKNHPLGGGRFMKDFLHTTRGQVWWDRHGVEDRREEVDFMLFHPLYHYSTDNINMAETFYERDKDDIRPYLDVEFIPVWITLVDA